MADALLTAPLTAFPSVCVANLARRSNTIATQTTWAGENVTLALDTSALLAVAVDGGQRRIVLDALGAHAVWAASAMALTEALPAIDRLTDEPILRADLEDAIRLMWDHLHVVPVDQQCLDDAARLSRARPIRLTDAIHLAAAGRLPPPVSFLTFDPAHIASAVGLGFEVVST